MKKIRIATRKSQLALWQANFVADRLRSLQNDLEIEIIGLSTKGDEILDKSLSKIGGKGLFIKSLETALIDNKADIAVHSMKDVGADLPLNLPLGAFLPRHSPYDCVVGCRLASLPSGGHVGTSSLRRMCQLISAYPHLIFSPLRGNVNTRLSKLSNGDFDAIILAKSGLDRLDLSHHISETLTPDMCLPAITQGTIGVQYRKGDMEILTSLNLITDKKNTLITLAERGVNDILNGSCQTPMAAFAEWCEGGQMHLKALVMCQKTLAEVKVSLTASVLNEKDARLFGQKVGKMLMKKGADKYLANI